MLPRTMAAIDRGELDTARRSYNEMASLGGVARSVAQMGLADLALYTGQLSLAEEVLIEGISEDEEAENNTGVALKCVELGRILSTAGWDDQAQTYFSRGLQGHRELEVLVPTALAHSDAGHYDQADEIAAELGGELSAQARSYSQGLRGYAALQQGDTPSAIDHLREAKSIADLWLTRYFLGTAYLQASAFPQAMSELEVAFARRGEATALFLDEMPTFHYSRFLTYHLGIALDEIGLVTEARRNFRRFINVTADRRNEFALDADKRIKSIG